MEIVNLLKRKSSYQSKKFPYQKKKYYEMTKSLRTQLVIFEINSYFQSIYYNVKNRKSIDTFVNKAKHV